MKMTKTEIKKMISQHYGFKTNLITLLETSTTYGEISYVMFEVLGIEYQSSLHNGNWELIIYKQ
jgi:ribosomal protein S24E